MDRLSKILGAGLMASSLLFVSTSAFAADGEIKGDLTSCDRIAMNCTRIIERFVGIAGSCAATSKSLKETEGNCAATSRTAAQATQRSRRIEKRSAAIEERSKAIDTNSGGITGTPWRPTGDPWRQTRAATRYQRLESKQLGSISIGSCGRLLRCRGGHLSAVARGIIMSHESESSCAARR